jgi:hypothetical protein
MLKRILVTLRRAWFEAIARTLRVGSVGCENATNERGEKLIWLDRAVVDRLRSLRGPGESFSDVILRLAAESG